MRKFLFVLSIVTLTFRLPAQTNEVARLALIPESPEASAIADVLTAELSGHKNLELLERNEIEKVYREQSLATGNKDYLKLGQILGADGLLLLEKATEGTNQFLNVRLIAVKPGVVLTAERFSGPVADLTEWSSAFAKHLDLFTPKLSVLVKDTIPIAVVNLRSAVQSDEALELEKQLKLLTVQRLSREPQLFVLERQKMQLLTEEKGLKLDDSAFWNGSYLLEGVVDQNGYARDTVTLNARLTPPKGGTPILFEVSDSRTNFAGVINQLAAKVIEALKVSPTAKEWNAADEAAQYFDEAKWAMRWGIYSEAQAAVDSAWALGKHDLDCALVRISAYLKAVPSGNRAFQNGEMSFQPGTEWDQKTEMKDVSEGYVAIVFDKRDRRTNYIDGKISSIGYGMIVYTGLDKLPSSQNIDGMLHALELYEESSRILFNNNAKIGINSSRQNIDWYQLGLDDLVVAARILQQFNFVPDAQKPVAEKLADLRAAARSVAGLIPKDFSGVANEYDSIDLTPRNISRCKIDWGCFWQENPEDCVAMYRDLMDNSNFEDIVGGLLSRPLQSPRLVAWSEEDRKRIPVLWGDFVQELSASTNIDCQMLGKAFIFRNVDGNEDAAAGWAALEPERKKMEAERQRDEAEKEIRQAFEKRKQYLRDNKPFDPQEFVQLFVMNSPNYSKAQALQIQPLLAAYKSNLVNQTQGAPNRNTSMARMGIMQIGMVESEVARVLNPPAPSSQPQIQTPAPRPPVAAAVTITSPVTNNSPEIVTNILTVNKFLEIPLAGLPGDQISGAIITAHHWFEGKLLLDFQYNNQYGSPVIFPAVAILDPASEQWQIGVLPQTDTFETDNARSLNPYYHRSVLWHGDLFTCEMKEIKKYDSQSKAWQTLAVSDGNNYELFVVNDRFYAANETTIFEILDGGKSSHLLASTRRQPPISKLDSENLGLPTLFEGPQHSLCAVIGKNIYAWDGNDWQKEPEPDFNGQQEMFDGALIFRSIPAYQWQGPQVLWVLQKNQPRMQLGLYRKPEQVAFAAGGPKSSGPPEKPLWKLPADLSFNFPATMHQSDLYLLANHSQTENVFNEEQQIIGKKFLAKDGCHAELICVSSNLPAPQKFFLNFDSPGTTPPVSVELGSWMFFTSDLLFFGLESPRQGMLPVAGNENDVYKPGVWLMPHAKIELAITGQKQTYLTKQKQESALATTAAAQTQKSLLAKYDRNHNGVIDPDEKEQALDDSTFIESELDAIDANHSGWLDATDLICFDANQNKTLEPKEQAGIEIAQHLLAEKFFKKADVNGDGRLDRQEFDALEQFSKQTDNRPMHGSRTLFPDENRDGYVDLEEWETFLKQQTRSGLRLRGMPGTATYIQSRQDTNQPLDQRQLFKLAVEVYWQNSSGGNNRPTSNTMP